MSYSDARFLIKVPRMLEQTWMLLTLLSHKFNLFRDFGYVAGNTAISQSRKGISGLSSIRTLITLLGCDLVATFFIF